jgi:hypothetical protein
MTIDALRILFETDPQQAVAISSSSTKTGHFVTIEGKVVFIGGPGSGGGSAKPAKTPKHSIKLPPNPKKLTIQLARAAMKQLGMQVGEGHYDMASHSTSYNVTFDDGHAEWLPVRAISDLVYSTARSKALDGNVILDGLARLTEDDDA